MCSSKLFTWFIKWFLRKFWWYHFIGKIFIQRSNFFFSPHIFYFHLILTYDTVRCKDQCNWAGLDFAMPSFDFSFSLWETGSLIKVNFIYSSRSLFGMSAVFLLPLRISSCQNIRITFKIRIKLFWAWKMLRLHVPKINCDFIWIDA